MEDILANPAVQAGFAPFLCALAFAAALRRSHLAGLAAAIGFTVAVGLTVGFAFESLTAMRKLVIVASCCAVLMAVLPSRLARSRARRAVFDLAAGAAGIWVVWRLLAQQPEAGSSILFGAGVFAYLALLMESSLLAVREMKGAAAMTLIQGITAGALCILGASALLAQIGIATGAGAAASLLVQFFNPKRSIDGWAAAAFGALTLGLVDLLAVFTGSLPWHYLLLPLAVPWIVKVASGLNFPRNDHHRDLPA
jgi:hypothetical protein